MDLVNEDALSSSAQPIQIQLRSQPLHRWGPVPKRACGYLPWHAGLDSATTFTVVKYLGDLSRTMRCTTVVSLLQPSGDVLALFDDIMLLAGG